MWRRPRRTGVLIVGPSHKGLLHQYVSAENPEVLRGDQYAGLTIGAIRQGLAARGVNRSFRRSDAAAAVCCDN